jgi:hypothetical protein
MEIALTQNESVAQEEMAELYFLFGGKQGC